MNKLTDEQVEDVKSREKQGLEKLKELGLTPAVYLQWENIGGDRFALKPIPFLQDTKYTSTPSPIQA